MFEITKITKEEGHKIIDTNKPLGLFWFKDKDKYIAIDNSDGDAFVEEFKYKSDSHAWLELSSEKDEDELNVIEDVTNKTVLPSYHAEVKRVSELMTNMIVLEASTEEMERAIDYSMDVLDTFKRELRCKQSKIDNDIDELVKRYGDEV